MQLFACRWLFLSFFFVSACETSQDCKLSEDTQNKIKECLEAAKSLDPPSHAVPYDCINKIEGLCPSFKTRVKHCIETSCILIELKKVQCTPNLGPLVKGVLLG